ncbi:MAG: VC0807 family protein [Luteolibacter sp.]
MSHKPENPLVNIMVNVLVPVLALGTLSKDPAIQEKLGKAAHWWQLGPVYGLAIALALPLGYGIWFFVRNRKANFFSLIGLLSVALTGCITIYLWNKDGTVKPGAAALYGLKEAAIPLALAFAILFSHRTPNPLLRVFLYNDALFDIPKIEGKIGADEQPGYAALLWRSTRLFATSFFVSSALNLGLSLFLFRGFDHTAGDALETYNAIIGKITWMSMLVVLVPAFGFLFLTLQRLVAGLRALTGLTDDEIMLPR